MRRSRSSRAMSEHDAGILRGPAPFARFSRASCARFAPMSEAAKISIEKHPLARPLSALELAAGAGIVLGHNVWRVLPNEVPILFVMALVSNRLREGGWAALGFRRPKSWAKTIAIAVSAAAARILIGNYAIDPFTAHFWPPAKAPAGAEHIAHNPAAA